MSRKKILLVDDSKTAILMNQMILKRFSFDVVTASDGEEALPKAIAERPDLILLDVMMPKKNGIEALKDLRASEATKDIPVIMVTTRSEADSFEAAFTSGCNDYVTKPVDPKELLAKIESLIGPCGEVIR